MLSLYEYIAIDKVTQRITKGVCHIQNCNNGQTDVFQNGLTYFDINPKVSVVQYYPNSITLWPTSPEINYSWDFTGCAMGLCNYKGRDYVCHIALDGNDSFSGSKNQKWDAVRKKIRFRNIFFPFEGQTKKVFVDVLQKNNNGFTTCIGLIINDNCYSMVFDKKRKRLVSIEQWALYNPYNQDLYSSNGKNQLQYSKQFKLL